MVVVRRKMKGMGKEKRQRGDRLTVIIYYLFVPFARVGDESRVTSIPVHDTSTT